MEPYSTIPITEWALEERPREKLLSKGINSLTEAELLAIILGNGTRELSAVDLGRNLLKNQNGIQGLARSSVNELIKIKGIGPAKAIAIVAAFELGRRKNRAKVFPKRITCSRDAADYLRPILSDLDHEVFYVLFLDRNNQIKGEKQISIGGVSSTIIDPRLVFREAINYLASGIVISHNHPSGNLKPSEQDLSVTAKIMEAGKLLDTNLLDHIIITNAGYYSFADEGNI